MIELYINGKLADVASSEKIEMTYEQLTADTPTAVKNSYSKSINLDGTPRNNDIFSNIYNLDFNVIDLNFDPRIRTPFTLLENGEVVDAGYIQLNNITRKGNKITYNINLYGELGNFFYNLQYDEDGKQLTLADLYYGFQRENGTIYTEDEERNANIITWDRHFIKEGWDKLKSNNFNDRKPSTFIKGCPTYSGYYPDFDSNKVAVNISSLTEEQHIALIPEVPSWYDKYIIIETQRDFDEWESRDLRSIYQRPAVKLDFILNKILEYNKNGWTVSIDDEIKNSPYFNKTWLLLNRLDFEKSTQSQFMPIGGFGEMKYKNTGRKMYQLQGFNTTGMQNPKLNIDFNVSTYYREDSDMVVCTTAIPKNKTVDGMIYGGYLVYVEIYKNGVFYEQSPKYFYTTYVNGDIITIGEIKEALRDGNGYTTYILRFQKLMKQKYGVDASDLVIVYENMETIDDYHHFRSPLKIQMNVPKDSDISIRLNVERIAFDESGTNKYFCSRPKQNYSEIWVISNQEEDTVTVTGSGYYDGDINPQTQLTEVNKQVLFGNTATPFDYLTSFTKMFNFKYDVNLQSKKINILPRNKYYFDEVIDINADIDRLSDIKIKPTSIDNKFYKYGLQTPETYASLLYKKKNKDEYGNYTFTTPYNFNSNTKDLFENNIYSNVIPYRLNSSMFSYIKIENSDSYYPTFAVPFTYKFHFGDRDITKNGAMATLTIPKYYDSVAKLCCFDNSNSNSDDITQSIVFQDGFKSYPVPITISDNNDAMIEANENPCYIFDNNYDTRTSEIPLFSKYLSGANGNYTHSLDFVKPSLTFIGDESKYSDDVTMVSNYWMSMLNDMYSKNSRIVTVKCRLKHRPQQALKYFYSFDNSLWMLSKINNYNSANEFQECEFIKIESKNNYIS